MEYPGQMPGDVPSGGLTQPPAYMPLQPQIFAIKLPQQQKSIHSCPLIGFGSLLLLICGSSTGLSIWLLCALHFQIYAGVSLICSLPFLVLASLCIFGGCDTKRRKCIIVTDIILALVLIAPALISLMFNLVGYAYVEDTCQGLQNCEAKVSKGNGYVGLKVDCNKMCRTYLNVHFSLTILAGLEALLAIILSISACCKYLFLLLLL